MEFVVLFATMFFITQTNTGAMVKRVPQEQMLDIKSYISREPFSDFFWICHDNVVWRCFKFLVSVNNLFESKNFK